MDVKKARTGEIFVILFVSVLVTTVAKRLPWTARQVSPPVVRPVRKIKIRLLFSTLFIVYEWGIKRKRTSCEALFRFTIASISDQKLALLTKGKYRLYSGNVNGIMLFDFYWSDSIKLWRKRKKLD